MATTLSDKHLSGFVSAQEFDGIASQIKAAHEALHELP